MSVMWAIKKGPLFPAGCMGQRGSCMSQSSGAWLAPPECPRGSQGYAAVRKEVGAKALDLLSFGILAVLF